MKFGIIDPKARAFDYVDAKEPHDVCVRAGLPHPMETDNGVLMRLPTRGGIGYIIYEYALFVPSDRQHYCAVGDTLIAGTIVLYEYDEAGFTIDLDERWQLNPVWFKSAAEVEIAIAAGAVRRPEMKINNEVIWSWPQPAPPDIAERVAG